MPRKAPYILTHPTDPAQAQTALTEIFKVLYFDNDTGQYDPELEWDVESIERVAEVLARHGWKLKLKKR